MTPEEIKETISKIKANTAIPDKQKEMLVAKYTKMLGEAPSAEPATPAPAKKVAGKPGRKTGTVMPKKEKPKAQAQKAGDEEYDCEKIIKEAKERKAKAKARLKKLANEPKHTPATKNRDAVAKVAEKVTENVEKRIETKKVSISEIEKLIDGAKEYLKTLEGILKKAKDAGIMAKGGSVSDDVYSSLVSEAKNVKVGHCGCSGNKMAK